MDYTRDYAITRSLPGHTVSGAATLVRQALATEGFGVLTEIDVQATLKKKIDLDRPPYLILGACNPALAAQALAAEPTVGLFLPCNVTVFEGDDGVVYVQAIRPRAMFSALQSDALHALGDEVDTRLTRALDVL